MLEAGGMVNTCAFSPDGRFRTYCSSTPRGPAQEHQVTTVTVGDEQWGADAAPHKLSEALERGLVDTLAQHPISCRLLRRLDPAWRGLIAGSGRPLKRFLARWPGLVGTPWVAADGAEITIFTMLAQQRRRHCIEKVVGAVMDASVPHSFFSEDLGHYLELMCSSLPDMVPRLLASLDKRLTTHPVTLRVESSNRTARHSRSADRSRVWAAEVNDQGVVCEAYRVACKGLGRRALLEAMVGTGHYDIFKSKTVALVVEEMWEVTKSAFIATFFLKGLYGIAFTLVTTSTEIGAWSGAQGESTTMVHFPLRALPAAAAVGSFNGRGPRGRTLAGASRRTAGLDCRGPRRACAERGDACGHLGLPPGAGEVRDPGP